eukprot:6191597-Pleurochrysis_carterae.AAC.1
MLQSVRVLRSGLRCDAAKSDGICGGTSRMKVLPAIRQCGIAEVRGVCKADASRTCRRVNHECTEVRCEVPQHKEDAVFAAQCRKCCKQHHQKFEIDGTLFVAASDAACGKVEHVNM